jgi:hypothetical protein
MDSLALYPYDNPKPRQETLFSYVAGTGSRLPIARPTTMVGRNLGDELLPQEFRRIRHGVAFFFAAGRAGVNLLISTAALSST